MLSLNHTVQPICPEKEGLPVLIKLQSEKNIIRSSAEHLSSKILNLSHYSTESEKEKEKKPLRKFSKKTLAEPLSRNDINKLIIDTLHGTDPSPEKIISPAKEESLNILFHNTLNLTCPFRRKKDKMGWLKKNNYHSLVYLLKGKKLFPWKDIFNLESPMLIEMLANLESLLQYKSNFDSKPILELCLELSKSQELSLREVLSIVGKIIYLAERDLEGCSRHISLANKKAALFWIHNSFEEILENSCQNIQNHYQKHLKAGIQHPEIAVNVFTPIEICKLILTDNGYVNIGIIDAMIDKFVKQPQSPLNFESHLLYGLRLLQTSPILRSMIKQVKAPQSPNDPIQKVIQATLKLAPENIATDRQARETALSAILSHLRQTPGKSCFAESLAIELLSSQLEQCLEDFTNLLKNSKLSRHVEKTAVDFPFLLRMENQSVDTEIRVAKNGTLQHLEGEEFFLWDAPGIQAVCLSMGILDPKNAICKCLDAFFVLDLPFTSVKLGDLIKSLAILNSSDDSSSSEKFIIGCFTLESELAHPLIKVWRNSIAGMAEAEENSMIKSAISKSLIKTLNVTFTGLSTEGESIKNAFYHKFAAVLKKKISILYEPHLLQRHTHKGTICYESAFILYDRNGSDVKDWMRVDSPQDFQKFVERTLNETQAMVENNLWKNSKKEILKKIVNGLIGYVYTESFIKKILTHYYAVNNFIKNPLIDFDSIEYAPWMTKSGNKVDEVMKIYMEHSCESKTKIIFPTSPKFLLEKIILYSKKMPSEEKEAYKFNPLKKIPVKIAGLHSFSLMLGHPTIADAWDSSIAVHDWIQTHIVDPGTEIATSQVSQFTRKRLFDFCAHKLISKKKRRGFIEALEMIPEKISHKDLRQTLIKLLGEFDPLEKQFINERNRLLDTALYQFLPDTTKETLERSAVHFADTNWNEGIFDIHFCFVVNPGNGMLEMWESYDNGSNLIALDQKYWLLNRTWELYNNPEKIIPQNELLHLKSA